MQWQEPGAGHPTAGGARAHRTAGGCHCCYADTPAEGSAAGHRSVAATAEWAVQRCQPAELRDGQIKWGLDPPYQAVRKEQSLLAGQRQELPGDRPVPARARTRQGAGCLAPAAVPVPLQHLHSQYDDTALQDNRPPRHGPAAAHKPDVQPACETAQQAASAAGLMQGDALLIASGRAASGGLQQAREELEPCSSACRPLNSCCCARQRRRKHLPLAVAAGTQPHLRGTQPRAQGVQLGIEPGEGAACASTAASRPASPGPFLPARRRSAAARQLGHR